MLNINQFRGDASDSDPIDFSPLFSTIDFEMLQPWSLKTSFKSYIPCLSLIG